MKIKKKNLLKKGITGVRINPIIPKKASPKILDRHPAGGGDYASSGTSLNGVIDLKKIE